MEDKTRIWKPTEPAAPRDACLVHIYPTGQAMGSRYPLTDKPLTIGRQEDNVVRIDDESVSRHHAVIEKLLGGYLVRDLQSTNGTFVNNLLMNRSALKDGDYVRVGNCILRFLAGGNIEAEYHEEIYRLTIVDALTECHNKRYLLEFLGRELTSASRYRRPLTLVLFDIDRFKGINDKFGHLCGDFTLRQLAVSIRPTLRREDLLARYGGEEFAVVLPDTPLPQGLLVAERLRELVETYCFEYSGEKVPVTISLGVATVSGEDWLTTPELIKQADCKLYQAKHEGRNCVRA